MRPRSARDGCLPGMGAPAAVDANGAAPQTPALAPGDAAGLTEPGQVSPMDSEWGRAVVRDMWAVVAEDLIARGEVPRPASPEQGVPFTALSIDAREMFQQDRRRLDVTVSLDHGRIIEVRLRGVLYLSPEPKGDLRGWTVVRRG